MSNQIVLKKQKEAWGIFSFFLPQMLKRRMSALLPITYRYTQLVLITYCKSLSYIPLASK